MSALKCFCCPSTEAEQREEYGEDGPFCADCHHVWVAENTPSTEHEEFPYDVEVALQRLSRATDTMLERWQHRGWDTSTVADKLRERLTCLMECL